MEKTGKLLQKLYVLFLLIPSPPPHSGLNREGVMEKVRTCSYVRTTESAVREFNRRRGSKTRDETLKIELSRYFILFYSSCSLHEVIT